MPKLRIQTLVLGTVTMLLMAFAGAALGEPQPSYRFSVDQSEVATFRLEIFDEESHERVYDSGLVQGTSLELSDEDFSTTGPTNRLLFELRTWNHAGGLLGSHTSSLVGVPEIFSIGFEQISQGIQLLGDTIDLEGSTNILGDLTVSGVTRTVEIQDTAGGNFFGLCATSSAIRTIENDGTVVCEPTGDDLGNHTATSNIRLNNRFLSGDGGSEGIFVDSQGRVGIGTTDPGLANLRIDGTGNTRLGFNTNDGTPVLRLTSFDSDPAVLAMVSGAAQFQLRVTGDDKFHLFRSASVLTVDSLGRLGLGTENPSFLLHVNGDAGKPGGGSWSTASDARLKEIEKKFVRGLEDLENLQPVHYHYQAQNPLGFDSEKHHVGLLAQDVLEVVPEAVSEDADGYLHVNNDPILWTMLNAILELERRNSELRHLICTEIVDSPGCN